MKKRTKLIYIVLIINLLLSCTNKQKIQLKTLSGYISWQQKNWAKSTGSFYKALNISKKSKDNDSSSYSNFNIASTYLMQNEDDSAYLKLKNIEESDDMIFMSSVFYQKGIIAFKNKNYEEAVEYFKKSIEYNPKLIDAKINFELSKKYFDSKYNQSQESKLTKINKKKKKISDEIIMNLIRKKEKEACSSQEKEKKNSFANDY